MSTTAELDKSQTDDQQDSQFEYRALHTGSIVGLVLGGLSVFTLIAAASTFEGCLMVAPIPLVGMFISLRAWAAVSRDPDQYTGKRLAMAGFALSLVFLVTGVSYGAYVYATEVPTGYERISFGILKPNELEERGGHLVPKKIAELDGQQVFIKGYIRPGSTPVRTGIESFLLVRDSNNCCFGDLSQVKYFDQMQVALTGRLRLDYSSRIFRVGGKLHVHPENLGRGPIFFLEADYAL